MGQARHLGRAGRSDGDKPGLTAIGTSWAYAVVEGTGCLNQEVSEGQPRQQRRPKRWPKPERLCESKNRRASVPIYTVNGNQITKGRSTFRQQADAACERVAPNKYGELTRHAMRRAAPITTTDFHVLSRPAAQSGHG